MNSEPKRQEPEIVPSVPDMVPGRSVPEVPPHKDAPEKKGPAQGGVDVQSSFDGV